MTYVSSNGYVRITGYKGHPLANKKGEVYAHRLIAYADAGRDAQPGEHVHHIDGNKRNNRAENLKIVPAKGHIAEHHSSQTFITDAELERLILLGYGCRDLKGISFRRFGRVRNQRGLQNRAGTGGNNGKNARMLHTWWSLTGNPKYVTCASGHRKPDAACPSCVKRVAVGRMS